MQEYLNFSTCILRKLNRLIILYSSNKTIVNYVVFFVLTVHLNTKIFDESQKLVRQTLLIAAEFFIFSLKEKLNILKVNNAKIKI